MIMDSEHLCFDRCNLDKKEKLTALSQYRKSNLKELKYLTNHLFIICVTTQANHLVSSLVK